MGCHVQEALQGVGGERGRERTKVGMGLDRAVTPHRTPYAVPRNCVLRLFVFNFLHRLFAPHCFKIIFSSICFLSKLSEIIVVTWGCTK